MKLPLLALFLGMTLEAAAQSPSQNSSSVSLGSGAQDLTLFEAVEETASRASANNRPSREARVTTSEPEFTLMGLSKIGGNHSVILRHKSGETFLMKAGLDASTPIQSYSGYSIVDISSRSVSIEYPANNPCVDFNNRGVRCSTAGNIAELVLANGEPLPPNNSLIAQGENRSESEAGEANEELTLDSANPFEALRSAQNARQAEGQGINPANGRFTPRRINPEDVPEGMRIVATPFGDRLVEQ